MSVWRTLFVANEWNEIQTYRKVPHHLLLMGVYACLYLLDATELAALLERYAPIESLRLVRDKSCAFLNFATEQVARALRGVSRTIQ